MKDGRTAKTELTHREAERYGVQALGLQETRTRTTWRTGWSTAAAPHHTYGVLLAFHPDLIRAAGMAEGATPPHTADPSGRWVRARVGDTTWVSVYAPVDPDERQRWAVEALDPLLAEVTGRLVVMGDMNEEPTDGGGVWAVLAAAGLTDTWVTPLPTRVARPGTTARSLDHILTRGVEVGAPVLGLPVSDHRLVVVDGGAAATPTRSPFPTIPWEALSPDGLKDIKKAVQEWCRGRQGVAEQWDAMKRLVVAEGRRVARDTRAEDPMLQAAREAEFALAAAATQEEDYEAAEKLHAAAAAAWKEKQKVEMPGLRRDWRTVSKRLVRSVRPRRRPPTITEAYVKDQRARDTEEVTRLLHARYADLYAKKQVNVERLRRHVRTLAEQRGPVPGGAWEKWTTDEAKAAVARYRKTAAPGADGIPPSVWCVLVDIPEVAEAFTKLVNDAVRTGRSPASWKASKTIMLHKGKLEPQDLTGWRPIALSCVDYRVFAAMAVQRMRAATAHTVGEAQLGFLPGRSAYAHVWGALAWLADPPPDTAMAFFDLQAAYDSLPQNVVRAVMRELQFPTEAVNAAKVAMADTWTRVQDPNGEWTERVTLETGVRQGCPLAPLLFIIGIAPLTAAIEAKGMSVKAMADDMRVDLRRNQAAALGEVLRDWENAAVMRFAPQKSAVLPADEPDQWTDAVATVLGTVPVLRDGQTYQYLGWAAATTEAAAAEATWDGVIRKATKVVGQINRAKGVTVPTRQLLTASLLLPIGRYAAQFSQPTEKQLRRLQWLVHVATWRSGTPAATLEATRHMHELRGPCLDVEHTLRTAAHGAVARATRSDVMYQIWLDLVRAKATALAGWPEGATEELLLTAARPVQSPGAAVIRRDWTWQTWTRLLSHATVPAELRLHSPWATPLRATTLNSVGGEAQWPARMATYRDYATAPTGTQRRLHLGSGVRQAAAAGREATTDDGRRWSDGFATAAKSKRTLKQWLDRTYPTPTGWVGGRHWRDADVPKTRKLLQKIWKRDARAGAFNFRTLLRAWPMASRLAKWLPIADRCPLCRSGTDEWWHLVMECPIIIQKMDEWAGRHNLPAHGPQQRSLFWAVALTGTTELTGDLVDAVFDATVTRMRLWHARGYTGKLPTVRPTAGTGRSAEARSGTTTLVVNGYAHCNHAPRCRHRAACANVRRRMALGAPCVGVKKVTGLLVQADGRVEPNDDDHPARRAVGHSGTDPVERHPGQSERTVFAGDDTTTSTNEPTPPVRTTQKVPLPSLDILDSVSISSDDGPPPATKAGACNPAAAEKSDGHQQGAPRSLGYKNCNHFPRCPRRNICAEVRRSWRRSKNPESLPRVVEGLKVSRAGRVESNDDTHPARRALHLTTTSRTALGTTGLGKARERRRVNHDRSSTPVPPQPAAAQPGPPRRLTSGSDGGQPPTQGAGWLPDDDSDDYAVASVHCRTTPTTTPTTAVGARGASTLKRAESRTGATARRREPRATPRRPTTRSHPAAPSRRGRAKAHLTVPGAVRCRSRGSPCEGGEPPTSHSDGQRGIASKSLLYEDPTGPGVLPAAVTATPGFSPKSPARKPPAGAPPQPQCATGGTAAAAPGKRRRGARDPAPQKRDGGTRGDAAAAQPNPSTRQATVENPNVRRAVHRRTHAGAHHSDPPESDGPTERPWSQPV